VVYEIFPRQFSATGDLAGITGRLDELKDLGVDVLWLMPIHPIGRLKSKGTIGSPYAVQDYYAVNPDYGTKDDLHRLIEGAHTRRLKVIIDVVANHTAWDSVMMAHPKFYKQDAAGHVIPPHPEWQDVAGLNYGNADTRQYMRDMLKYWVRDFQIDGIRCDDAGDVPTDFWEDVHRDLEGLHPGFFMLAEASKPELLAHAFNADYAWPMLAALNRVLMAGAPATDLRQTWETEEQLNFPRGALHLHMSDDHDEARAISRYGWNGALAASAMLLMFDGVPLLYNGMEVGDTSESGDPALFERVPILWAPHQRDSFRANYRALIAYRRAHPSLRDGTLTWLNNSDPRDVISFLRRDAQEEIVTVVNFSNRRQEASVQVGRAPEFVLELASEKAAPVTPSLDHERLEAFGWHVYRRVLGP
jgi:cyclomaltodextrinase